MKSSAHADLGPWLFEEFGHTRIRHGIFVKEPVIFLDKGLAELGGKGCFLDIQSLGFAGEDLPEICDVPIDCSLGMPCTTTGFQNAALLQKEKPADLFFVGKRRSQVVN